MQYLFDLAGGFDDGYDFTENIAQEGEYMEYKRAQLQSLPGT